MRHITVFAAIVGFGVLTACGAGSQADGQADGPQLDAAPCSQVLEAYDEHQQLMVSFSGVGVEGREAQQAVVELIEARPDCFREDTVESVHGLRELLPASDAEREAIEAAEARCADGVGGGFATSKDSPDAATPEAALADGPHLPLGEPEPVAETDDWVAFDFVDDGVYEGHAIVQRAGDGWYVRRTIDCRGVDAVAEEDGEGRG